MDQLVKIAPLVLKSTLKNHVVLELLTKQILDEFAKVPNIQSFRMDNEMTELICNVVENAVVKKHKKDKPIDKKAIVCKILMQLFNLQPPELVTISKQIDYLCENKLIKKEKKSILSHVPNFFSKKSKQ
jgi:hypothetical protein